MLARVGTAQYPALPARTGVSIIKNISGPIELTYGSVLFHLPDILLARCTSSRQMLMHSIVQQSGSGLGSALTGNNRVKERCVTLAQNDFVSLVMMLSCNAM
jgi:hypothetical protein